MALIAGAIYGVAHAAKNTILGTALSPAHVPNSSDRDIDRFFDQASEIGSHVTWIVEWQSMPPPMYFRVLQEKATRKGLKFNLFLSPIALVPGRKDPAIPKSAGGNSFADAAVRDAYKNQVLTLAAMHPDSLGLATEINFLAANPPEFEALASLLHEAYQSVKRSDPSLTVTISFQWDVMVKEKQTAMLKRFADSLDVYSLTSYPESFGDPSRIPADYYRAVRETLPTQRIGIAEIGWSSAPPSSEDHQAAFFKRLPELSAGAGFEFITLALLHDVSLFKGELARVNDNGIRTIDDAPKKSWDVIVNLPDLH